MRLVVPSERHVERLARKGELAETRSALQRRLLEALAPKVKLAPPEATRLALAEALRAVAWEDELLQPLATAGSLAWLRTVDAVDEAIAMLRASNTPLSSLEKAERLGGGAARRAAMLRRAMVALDVLLVRAGQVDGRASGQVLAETIARTEPRLVVEAVGASTLKAQLIAVWEPRDLGWWRALDVALRRAGGGGAIIELPSFRKNLDPARQRDPLDVVLDDVARALDEAPDTSEIKAPLGDLRLDAPLSAPPLVHLELRQASDAHAQGRAVADAIFSALSAGIPIEEVAVALPRIDEEVLGAIRRAFDDAGIPAYDSRGPAPLGSGIVAAALDAHALGSHGLARKKVAALLRSFYLDAERVTQIDDPRRARRLLARLVTALEQTPTVAGRDAVSTLEATVCAYRPYREVREEDGASLALVARRVGDLLWTVECAQTRTEHIRAARELWASLGFPARASYDAKTTLGQDETPTGIARAELRALSRDAHAWEVLMSALAGYEAAVASLHLGAATATSEAFRHELLRTLEAGAPPPGAGRVGAVRIARLAELAHEKLQCLVIVDANEGVLPSAPARAPLLSEALASCLREIDPLRAPPLPVLRTARDLAHLALAVTGADRLIFTYRARDEEGGAMAPAPIVNWLSRQGMRVVTWHGSPIAERPITSREARLKVLFEAPERGQEVDSESARRAHIERSRESFHNNTRVREETVVNGFLAADESIATILREETGGSAEHPLPVTTLERFARCAFQGHAHHIMRAREAERRADTPDAREEGTLVHEALARAFRATRPMWRQRPRDAEAIRTSAIEAADAFFQREATASGLRKLALDQARESVIKVLEWSLHDLDWNFEVAEQPFGDASEEGWPALRLDDGETTLVLKGNIDRIDVSDRLPRAIRAVDYKTRPRKAKEAQKELGTFAFQVPFYARIARETLAAVRSEGLYLPMSELVPGYAPPVAFAAAWREKVETDSPHPPHQPAVVIAALDLLKRFRKGAIAPLPLEDRFCDHCEFDGGCRRPRFIVSEDEPED
jgi:RecB family exonuclease